MQPGGQSNLGQSNLGRLLEKALAVRQQLATARDELSRAELTGTAGNGSVAVTLCGTGEPVRVRIDPAVADPHDVARLEKLVLGAIREAQLAIRALTDQKTGTTA